MNEDHLEITICKSLMTKSLGAEVGVSIHHIPSGIVVKSTAKKTQYLNKQEAIEMLKLELVKKRFLNIDENDLVAGDLFFKKLDEIKVS